MILIRPALLLTHSGRFVAVFDHQGHRFSASVQLPPFVGSDPSATTACLRIAEDKTLKEVGRMLADAVNSRLISFDGGRLATRS